MTTVENPGMKESYLKLKADYTIKYEIAGALAGETNVQEIIKFDNSYL
ncbi:MAG: hypothetical protein K9L17_00760 [Clostridiales bacterium]|nr:hypothetical protein [Clostridiales bacterium]MCF8021223.1 hypothetical protein [Clostridiales bacterium]